MSNPNQKSNKTDDEKIEQKVRDNIFAGVQSDRPLADPKVEGWEKEFNHKFEQMVWKCVDVVNTTFYDEIKDFMSQQILKTKREMIEKVKKDLGKTFRGSASGLHGYQVLPSCAKNRHGIDECADCYLSKLEEELG